MVSDERGRGLPGGGLSRWLARIAPARARGVVSIALVSDRRMRALNRRYRGRDYATDVLSFPAAEPSAPAGRRSVAGAPVRNCLGDIAIAKGVARRQAQQARHSTRAELRLLALHGLLHLLGYDHELDEGRMRRAEQRLRRKGGLGAGLIERASKRS